MKKVLGRALVIIPAVALQVFWIRLVMGGLDKILDGRLVNIINIVFTVLGVLFILHLVSKRDESAYKLLWAIVILALPILGAILYVFLGNKHTGAKLKTALLNSAREFSVGEYARKGDLSEELKKEDLRLGQSFQHISKSTGYPVLPNGSNWYYSFGEEMFPDMCEDLKTAKDFIYVEYFIVQRGKFWDTLTDILAEKAAAGVDVRVMYDDLGSIGTYSPQELHELTTRGIKCIAFNPILFISAKLNNRDHRKIMVIDGRVAYSGGVNIADEYINEKEVYGRWKDIGFRVTGAGAASYTYMFAEFWNAFSNDKIGKAEIEPSLTVTDPDTRDTENGYILPYYDSPVREEHTSNVMYTEILSFATDYVWFFTPYLMLGDALFDAFIRAAERGVDVRIIMPGIPDKKMVYRLSRSYYRDLLKAGVRIFEYKPGFVHAKAVIADDKVAGIGTVNLDYRSLFLHFECNSLFYKADIIESLKKDYLKTLEECQERSLDDINNGHLYRFVDSILRVVAPLM